MNWFYTPWTLPYSPPVRRHIEAHGDLVIEATPASCGMWWYSIRDTTVPAEPCGYTHTLCCGLDLGRARRWCEDFNAGLNPKPYW